MILAPRGAFSIASMGHYLSVKSAETTRLCGIGLGASRAGGTG